MAGLNIRSLTQNSISPKQRHPVRGPATLAPAPVVYKYIRNKAGVVGTITNPAGIISNVTEDIVTAVGLSCAGYLDAHGFGSDEISCIVGAFHRATNVQEFTALAAGYGMAYTELEWFWSLS